MPLPERQGVGAHLDRAVFQVHVALRIEREALQEGSSPHGERQRIFAELAAIVRRQRVKVVGMLESERVVDEIDGVRLRVLDDEILERETVRQVVPVARFANRAEVLIATNAIVVIRLTVPPVAVSSADGRATLPEDLATLGARIPFPGAFGLRVGRADPRLTDPAVVNAHQLAADRVVLLRRGDARQPPPGLVREARSLGPGDAAVGIDERESRAGRLRAHHHRAQTYNL